MLLIDDGSNSFLNVDLYDKIFVKLYLHLKAVNFEILMTSMLLIFKNASLKIMNTIIFGSFHPFQHYSSIKLQNFRQINFMNLEMILKKRFDMKKIFDTNHRSWRYAKKFDTITQYDITQKNLTRFTENDIMKKNLTRITENDVT